jgi:hypothetical protein
MTIYDMAVDVPHFTMKSGSRVPVIQGNWGVR